MTLSAPSQHKHLRVSGPPSDQWREKPHSSSAHSSPVQSKQYQGLRIICNLSILMAPWLNPWFLPPPQSKLPQSSSIKRCSGFKAVTLWCSQSISLNQLIRHVPGERWAALSAQAERWGQRPPRSDQIIYKLIKKFNYFSPRWQLKGWKSLQIPFEPLSHRWLLKTLKTRRNRADGTEGSIKWLRFFFYSKEELISQKISLVKRQKKSIISVKTFTKKECTCLWFQHSTQSASVRC